MDTLEKEHSTGRRKQQVSFRLKCNLHANKVLQKRRSFAGITVSAASFFCPLRPDNAAEVQFFWQLDEQLHPKSSRHFSAMAEQWNTITTMQLNTGNKNSQYIMLKRGFHLSKFWHSQGHRFLQRDASHIAALLQGCPSSNAPPAETPLASAVAPSPRAQVSHPTPSLQRTTLRSCFHAASSPSQQTVQAAPYCNGVPSPKSYAKQALSLIHIFHPYLTANSIFYPGKYACTNHQCLIDAPAWSYLIIDGSVRYTQSSPNPVPKKKARAEQGGQARADGGGKNKCRPHHAHNWLQACIAQGRLNNPGSIPQVIKAAIPGHNPCVYAAAFKAAFNKPGTDTSPLPD